MARGIVRYRAVPKRRRAVISKDAAATFRRVADD